MMYAEVYGDFVVSLAPAPIAGLLPVEDTNAEVGHRTHSLTQSSQSGVYRVVQLSPDEVAERVALRWDEVRSERNARLAACDWTQLADAPLSTEQRAAWGAYRQALRDLPAQSDPFDLDWPTSP